MSNLRFGLNPNKEKILLERMIKVDIKESDLRERFIRAKGKGGQKVNKTSCCVYLKHLPSGTEVKCQKERSQALNRFFARRILTEKIEMIIFKKKSQKQKQIEKIKRQKRKRSKRAKEKTLKAKKIRSEKKIFRRIKPEIE